MYIRFPTAASRRSRKVMTAVLLLLCAVVLIFVIIMTAKRWTKLAASHHRIEVEWRASVTSIFRAALLPEVDYAKAIFTDPVEIFGSDVAGGDDNPLGRIPADCRSISHDGLAVLIVAGQSNATNATSIDKLYRPRHRFFNLDIDSTPGSDCFVAESHAYGTSGPGSAFVLPLGDDLLDSGLFQQILIVPIAVGGSYIEEWRAKDGRYFPRFERAIRALQSYGLTPGFILWHQGEGNAIPLVTAHTIGRGGSLVGTRRITVTHQMQEAVRINYLTVFFGIVDHLRALGVGAPIFPAIATSCGFGGIEPTVRAAQAILPDLRLEIFSGPDTDIYDDRYRLDQCHFNAEGTRLVAKDFAGAITAYQTLGPWRATTEMRLARSR